MLTFADQAEADSSTPGAWKATISMSVSNTTDATIMARYFAWSMTITLANSVIANKSRSRSTKNAAMLS